MSRRLPRRKGLGNRGGRASGSFIDQISINNAVAMSGGEQTGTVGNQDLAEAAAAAAFLPTINLTAWVRLRFNRNNHSRGLIGQWDYGTARRWQLTNGFSVGQERRLVLFFGEVGTDASKWSLTASADFLPATIDGRDLSLFVWLKMDEAIAEDRARVYLYDHSTGLLTMLGTGGDVAWSAAAGVPVASLPSTSTKLTVGNWNARPGVNGACAYFRAWGFHDVQLTTAEMLTIARDRKRVSRGEIDLFEPTHGYDATFTGKKGTVVTLKPATTRPVRIRLETFSSLSRCTLVGLVAGGAPARMQAGAAGRQHHGVSGQAVGDGTLPAAGTMNSTATADAALYAPDVILFEGGTNDIVTDLVLGSVSAARCAAFIRKVTDGNMARKVFWGTLTGHTNSTLQLQFQAHNDAMDAEIATLVGEGRNVTKVVLHDKILRTDDFGDAAHPAASGYHKIGARGWWDTIKASLPAGAYRMWIRGDSLMLGSQYNEAGETAGDGGPRVELIAYMTEAGH